VGIGASGAGRNRNEVGEADPIGAGVAVGVTGADGLGRSPTARLGALVQVEATRQDAKSKGRRANTRAMRMGQFFRFARLPAPSTVCRMDTSRRPQENPLWGDGWTSVRDQWILDPSVSFLNHGSFGACPRPVLDAQAFLREEMERQPVQFLWRRLEGLIGEARDRVAEFLNADPAGLAFVANATMGVATVLAGIELGAGDEVVMTDHAYPAVRNSAHRTCAARGANLLVQHVPLPLPAPEEIAGLVLNAVTDRTRLVIVDHVTSPTAAVFPVARIVEGCRTRGIPVFVDAAHVPGMFDLDLRALAPDFWTGNFHKWACAPKGAAVLFVAPEHREAVRPLVTSHGYGGSFHAQFDWTGTADPTPYLSIPAALEFMGTLGWERLRRHNHALAEHGRASVAEALATDVQVPESSFGSMAIVALPEGMGASKEDAMTIQTELYEAERIEVPFGPWDGRGYVRLSAQAYNAPAEYDRLASALTVVLQSTSLSEGRSER
jgi:isopenicillin-N epimerase